MELKWIGENIDRVPDADGNEIEVVNNKRYHIKDADGGVMGNATVYQTHAEISMMQIHGFNGHDEGLAKLKEIFGIE